MSAPRQSIPAVLGFRDFNRWARCRVALRKLGITVTDDEVLNGLMSRCQQFFPNGAVNKDQFEQYLTSQGMTIEDLSTESSQSAHFT